MKFEETIQYLFDNYPSIYQERWEVLNQLFCVIGNGYEWKNGELVYYDEEDLKVYPIILDENGKAKLREDKIKEKALEYFEEFKVKNIKERQKWIKKGLEDEDLEDMYPLNEDKLMKKAMDFATGNSLRKLKMMSSEIKFYPLSEHSAIFTIPDDIKHDWIEGVEEVVKLILEHGHGYTKEEEMNDWQKEQNEIWTKRLHELAEELALKKA